MTSNVKVSIVMGSDSDLTVMKHTTLTLDELEIPNECRIISAHRTPDECTEYARSAIDRGVEVIICAAGGAAHLGGAVAAQTTLPVICVPIVSTALAGLDSLLSIVQMPAGIPVACMAVGVPGAKNAALFAAEILAIKDSGISKRLAKYRSNMRDSVTEKDNNLRKKGVSDYVRDMEK